VHMKFPNYFADADARFDEADFVIFGVPYDKTSSFRKGADQAPKEIRHASWNFETYNVQTGVDLKHVKVHDYGDLDIAKCRPQKMIEQVKTFTANLVQNHKFPIALGGEHSLTLGIVQAFPKDSAVLSLDAHLDFREHYENEPYNHACVTRRIADHIPIENIAVIGVRSAEKEEYDQARDMGLFFVDVFLSRHQGFSEALKKTMAYLKGKNIYLTLDVDVLDPAYAPGTSTPEPFGLTPFDILEIIDGFSSQLIGFDLVEVCPPYDNGETSLLAARLIRSLIGAVWSTTRA